MIFGASALTRYLAGSRSAIAGIFPTSFVVLFVRQHRQHSNCSHLVAYVGYQSCFVILDIEDHAVSNGPASLRVRLTAGKLLQGGSTPSTILTQEPRDP